jgi:hypothetical protein
MRLELGTMVTCIDVPYGELADVVIDPTTNRVTHLVVEPQHEPWVAQLVPVTLARLKGRSYRCQVGLSASRSARRAWYVSRAM